VKLSDLDAVFVALDSDGSIRRLPGLFGAHAVMFECPCGKHSNLIAFEPTVGTEPTTRGGLSGSGGRWKRTGDSIDNLTLAPSIDVNRSAPGGSCWHGFVRNGGIVAVVLALVLSLGACALPTHPKQCLDAPCGSCLDPRKNYAPVLDRGVPELQDGGP
jgi:hypothetical protein